MGQAVIDSVLAKNGTTVGKASIEVTQAITNNVKGNASITISTTDFLVDGTITLKDGMLTWKEIEANTPSITINNAPETLGIGKSTTLTTEIKRTTGNPTITWTSGDANIATVGSNSGVVTGVAEGTVTITATINVDGTNYSGTCQITIVAPPPEPKVGDFVEYQAGSWTKADFELLGVQFITDPETGEEIIDENNMGYYAKNVADYKFSGFSIGDNKDYSIKPIGTNEVSNNLKKGWRILDTSIGEDGTVYITKIIHAGTPEQFSHLRNNASTAISAMTNRNWNMYVNSNYYGISAALLTFAEAENITGTTEDSGNDLRKTGNLYWLPLQKFNNDLYYVNTDGRILSSSSSAYRSLGNTSSSCFRF